MIDSRRKVGGCLEAVQEVEGLGGLMRLYVGTGERKHLFALLGVALMVFVDLAGSEVHSCFILSPPAKQISLTRMDILGNGLVVRPFVVGSSCFIDVHELAIPA